MNFETEITNNYKSENWLLILNQQIKGLDIL